MLWSLVAAAGDEEAEKYLSRISDKELIKLTAAVYNTHSRSREDKIARRVALRKLIAAARKRRSPEIDRSGILSYKYEKVSLEKWPVERLKSLYGILRKKHKEIDWKTFSYLFPREKALLFNREITIEIVSRIIMPRSRKAEAFRGSWWQ